MVTSIMSREGASLDSNQLADQAKIQPISFDPSKITIVQWLISLLKLSVAGAIIGVPLFIVWYWIQYIASH